MPDPIHIWHTPLSLQGREHGGGTPEAAQYAVDKVRYIGRESAPAGSEPCGAFLSGVDGATTMLEVATWMRDEILYNERSNGRLGEQIIASFPTDFTRAQRVETVQRFACSVTEGRISWFAGIHDLGGDARHPHTHIVFRDRLSGQERASLKAAGKRVVKGRTKLGWLNKVATKDTVGSTERFRLAWAEAVNGVYVAAGSSRRVEYRSAARQIHGDDAPPRRQSPQERAKYAIAEREAKDRSILQHASARLAAAEQAGRITASERLETQWRLREHLREQTTRARQRLQNVTSKV